MEKFITIGLTHLCEKNQKIWCLESANDDGQCLRLISASDGLYCYEALKMCIVAIDSFHEYSHIHGFVFNKIVSTQEFFEDTSPACYGIFAKADLNGEIVTYPEDVQCSICEGIFTCTKRFIVFQPDAIALNLPCGTF